MKRVALVLISASLISMALFAQTSESATQSSVANGPQTTYQPKFPGDKAHSDPEAAALGYMRTVLMAEKLYKKKHGNYATSLAALVGSGSFTKRMISPDRGDYKVGFRGTADKFSLTMEPKQFDAAHRAFFADETGAIRGEDDKPATASSPVLR